MTSDCPIYVANEVVIRADDECYRLLDAFQARMSARGFTLGKGKGKDDEEHDMPWRWVETYPILRGPRLRRPRAVTLAFDLYRGPSSEVSAWDHAREALLVVAYSSRGLDDPWTCSHLAISSDGVPKLCVDGGGVPDADAPKVLVYQATARQRLWSDRDWLFAVPLRKIASSDVLDRLVVGPLASMLSVGDAVAIDWSGAVSWPDVAASVGA